MADFPLQTYSFLDVYGTITGPGIQASFGNGTGQEDGGIAWDHVDDKNLMTIGASGECMHTLRGTDAGTITINLLKTAPLSAVLDAAYNYQKQSSLYWGQNIITVTNSVMGDHLTFSQCAFVRRAANSYPRDPAAMVWQFHVGHIYSTLGGATNLISMGVSIGGFGGIGVSV